MVSLVASFIAVVRNQCAKSFIELGYVWATLDSNSIRNAPNPIPNDGKDPTGPASGNQIKIVAQKAVSENVIIKLKYSGNYEADDFASLPSSVTILKGQTEALVDIKTNDNDITEPTKIVNINISSESHRVPNQTGFFS